MPVPEADLLGISQEISPGIPKEGISPKDGDEGLSRGNSVMEVPLARLGSAIRGGDLKYLKQTLEGATDEEIKVRNSSKGYREELFFIVTPCFHLL